MGENGDELAAEKSIYLHGDLELTIFGAKNLPNMDLSSQRLRRCISALNFRKHSDSNEIDDQLPLRNRVVSKRITSDPYVKVCLAGACVARTQVKTNSKNPEWNEKFHIPLAHRVSKVEFHVKDHDVFGADHIGIAKVLATNIASGEIDRSFDVNGSSRKTPKPTIHLKMKFTPCDKNPIYSKGIDGDFELKQSYFPMRPGGRVTLYQDAHVTNKMPEIELDDNTYFVHNKCWEDICHAILEARHMVYLMGWSIYDKVRLVRESTMELPPIGKETLGELLKHKSREGVRVLLLVWDDRTSQRKVYLKTKGVMATHDEETRKFFKHSSVICTLAPRYASDKLSFIKQHVVGTIYSHHQKCVIVDTQGSDHKRRITAFIGGLDLTDGRYDTPEHRLFPYNEDVFKDDFCNKHFLSGVKFPREPWHDLHCKIEGAAAYDVLTNFAQRWKRAANWIFGKQFKKTSPWRDDALIDLEHIDIPWITSPPKNAVIDPSLRVCKEDDRENWHVQVFRSIDSGSAKGFPKNPQEAAKRNLVFEKHIAIDRSIQMAYIQAIRSAQHFIYIENQYFIGSSYAWDSTENPGANNRIPMELALKITSKIRANERFSVYAVIPMWPEGDPKSASIQQILYWQSMTMKMMYKIIAEELKRCNLENAHPKDYLNFYCLGNRENPPKSEAVNTNGKPFSVERTTKRHSLGCFASDVKESDSYENGRFMVYVHSKGMIVDDEYVILGSANINQRSMAGSRDTEIAMGAYQPHYTWAKKGKHPHGQVYGYRMSLWAEHLGLKRIDDCFKDPKSFDCVKKVNSVAEENWKRYIAEEFKEPLEGHILKYPIQVEKDGDVRCMPKHESFPDVGGKILGSMTNLPYPLTT